MVSNELGLQSAVLNTPSIDGKASIDGIRGDLGTFC